MIIKTIRATRHYFAAVLLLSAFGLVNHPVTAAPVPEGQPGLTKAEQRDCYNKYDPDTYNLDKADGRQKLKDFKQSKCYSGNGGNCDYVVPTAEAVARGAANKALISCTNPDDTTTGGGGGGGGGAAGSGDGITDPALTAGGCTGENCAFIDAYINPFIKLLSALVGIVAIIFIIFGAIQVITSAGDPQKSARGKDHIRNALIGLVAFVLLYAILNWLIPGGIA